jgi:hypothetical protein
MMAKIPCRVERLHGPAFRALHEESGRFGEKRAASGACKKIAKSRKRTNENGNRPI